MDEPQMPTLERLTATIDHEASRALFDLRRARRSRRARIGRAALALAVVAGAIGAWRVLDEPDSTDVATEGPTTTLASPPNVDSAVLRAGIPVGDSIWYLGGLQGTPSAWEPVRSAAEVDTRGEVRREVELPLGDDQFFYGVWAGERDGSVDLIGTLCIVPISESPHCPLTRSGSMAVIFRVDPDGTVERIELPDLVVVNEEHGTEERSFQFVGASAASIFVTVATDFRVERSVFPSATVALFAIDAATGAVTRVETPPDTIAARGICVVDGDAYALSPAFADDEEAVAAFTISKRAVGDPAAAWSPVASLQGGDAHRAGTFDLACTEDDDVFVIALSPNTIATQVLADGAPISPADFDLAGLFEHAQVVGDRLIVTAADDEIIRVWEHRDRTWSPRLDVARSPGDQPMYVEIEGQLVDVGPSWGFSPDPGG